MCLVGRGFPALSDKQRRRFRSPQNFLCGLSQFPQNLKRHFSQNPQNVDAKTNRGRAEKFFTKVLYKALNTVKKTDKEADTS